MEWKKFQFPHELNRTFPCAEEQVYKVAVEIIVNVHAADLGLYPEQERAAPAERL